VSQFAKIAINLGFSFVRRRANTLHVSVRGSEWTNDFVQAMLSDVTVHKVYSVSETSVRP